MKKIYLLAVNLVCLLSIQINAQTSVEGDMSVYFYHWAINDSNACSVSGSGDYDITIQNSYLGQQIKFKSYPSNQTYFTATNNFGLNPWIYNTSNILSGQGMPNWASIIGLYTFQVSPVNIVCDIDSIFFFNQFSNSIPNSCSYGNVKGRVYEDINSNCIFDSTDVPLNAISVSGSALLNSPSGTNFYKNSLTNANGNYQFIMQKSWMLHYAVYISPNYQFIFPGTSCSPASFTFTEAPQDSVDFSLQCSSYMDVMCNGGSFGIVRPIVPFIFSPMVKNIGCLPASGLLKLVLDMRVVYNASLSSNLADSISGDTLMWNYANLSNLSNGAYWNSFFAGVHLTPVSSVNIGDTLHFLVSTDVPATDVNPSNNSNTIHLVVVNSYDPNIKEVNPQGVGTNGIIPQGTSELEYTIHFQNTGTAVANNISVIDTLDANILPGSLHIFDNSHTMNPTWLASNIIKFSFPNIHLPDSTSNEAMSHGFVRFSIKLDTLLAGGTMIQNKAGIYFDTNPAIITNTVANTIDITTGTNESKSTNGLIWVYPNPFNEETTFNIQSSHNENESYLLEMKDVLGKTVKTISSINTKQFIISRNGLENGIYFYSITNINGFVSNGKLIVK